MPGPATPHLDDVQFGVFALDLRTGELRKQGIRLKLQERPFKILAILLEQPGKLVTREQLRSRLWPDGVFVDFDHSISSAINKLRNTLGDSADAPRFIETVGGRGYRFAYPVMPLPSNDVSLTGTQAQPAAQLIADGIGSTSGAPHQPDAYAHVRRYLPALFIVMALSSAAIVGAALQRSRRIAKLSRTESLMLADFENHTGDPGFDGTLQQAVKVKLNESPHFNIVPETVPTGVSMNGAQSKCQAVGGRAVLGGTIASLPGGAYRVRVVAVACGDGSARAEEEATVPARNGVLPALGQVIDSLRRKLGEPAESVRQFHTPLEQATTNSLAALKVFTSGEEQRAQGKDYETVPLYTMAADLDPSFALAYARLGIIYSNAEEYETSRRYFQKAFDARERTTERERLYIMAHYYAANGELEKQRHVYELWRQLYPRDLVPPNNLVSLYLGTGQLEKGLEAARDAVRLGPDNAFPYMNLMQAYQEAGRFEEANAVYDQAVARKMDSISFHQERYITAFAQNDAAAMKRELEWAQGKSQAGEILLEAALSAMARGHVRRARVLFDQAEQAGIKNGLRQFAGEIRLKQAQFEGEIGFSAQAHTAVRRALELVPGSRDFPARVALVFARIGESRRAQEFLARVPDPKQSDSIMNQMVLPTVRAAVELQRGKPEAAIHHLQTVEPCDLSWIAEYSSIYYRGLANLQLHHSDEAAAQFEKIIKYWAIRPDSIYVVLARIGHARALFQGGDLASARAQYAKFLDLWKEADSDIPILRQAKAESAQLHANVTSAPQRKKTAL